VLAKAGSELVGVPDPMEGWNWATLGDFVEFDELEALLVEATRHAQAPGLAFSVHDSDSVFLLGADPSGLRFVLVVNPEGWEDELPRQEIAEAAAWSRDHAPLDPSAEEIADVLNRQFVFAEDGLDVLLARMGLLPAEAADGAEELADASFPPVSEIWRGFAPVDAPEEQLLEHGRWHATLEHGDVRGHLLAAVDAPREWVVAYGVRTREPIVELAKMWSREELSAEAARQGIRLGPWEEVPDDVPRDLASTAAWVLGQA
jgi:hypothetical protein